MTYYCFFFQAEDGIRDLVRSRGLGDVYKRQVAKALLKTGTQRMPDFHLNENEIEEIVTYLKYIDETTVINTITE